MKAQISINPIKKMSLFLILIFASAVCIGQPTVAESDFSKGLAAYEQSDYATAVTLFTKAAQNGDMEAQFYLGHLYRKGLGVTLNKEEAFKWLKKAAEQGYVRAQFDLGLMYASGYGVTKNIPEAIKWYRVAAQQGNPEAQYFLGRMYHKGQGLTQSNEEAKKWYKVAAGNGGHGIGKQLAVAALQEMGKHSISEK